MSNVIKLSREKQILETPEDLMSIKDFADKHYMKIGYLYKLLRLGKIQRYKRGVLKISEKETLKALQRVG